MNASTAAEQLYSAGRKAWEQGHWIAAEPLLQRAVALAPEHGSALHLLGKLRQQQGNHAEALQLQERSCRVDPAPGWNWFSAGELLAQQQRWADAQTCFEQALARLPGEVWIADHWQQVQMRLLLGGEVLRDGFGPQAYRYWIDHFEQRLPPSPLPMATPFWLWRENHWLALHGSAPLQPQPAPLGESPWPEEGWLVLLAPGVQLRDGVLPALERWLQGQQPGPDLVYGDEDRLDRQGERCDPWFKPGWLEESFWASPWLESCSLWRCSWLRHQCFPLPPADGLGRWRWLLEALNRQPQVQGWPQLLSHSPPPPPPDLRLQGQKAQLLRDQLKQRGEAIAAVTPHAELPGCFALQWALPQHWSCSVIIPTRDRADLLAPCLQSLWRTTAVARQQGLALELIVVDNGSVEPATTALLQGWRQQLGETFVVLRDDGPFNWSRLNNQAAARAQGELLLLLNNDVEALQPGWLEAMAAQALRPKVGAVGALLLYPDRTLQHGGLVVGLDSHAEHAYRQLPLEHGVHRGRSQLLSRWDAVTGACFLLRKQLLESLGGFDEGLPVEGNDVDLCLRLEQLGYHQLIPPQAVLLHHESQSRDVRQSSTEARAVLRLQRRWGVRLQRPGPCWPMQADGIHPDGRPRGLEQLP